MKKFVLPNIYFGGDYTPEHFPKEVMEEDMRLMKKAGVNIATINVFSWGQLQPNEETWTFEWLDEVMDTLAANGVYADLGTATASTPAWMAKKYPEILPVDENGIRYNHGSRQTFNPSSPKYRELSDILVRKLAERYKGHPALAMWHVNNELSQLLGYDYSEITADKFRAWCKDRFGSCEELNKKWGLHFWGNNIYEWDELMPPMKTCHQHSTSLLLDWKRFTNDCYMEVAKAEIDILREVTPDIPITTNFLYEFKNLDYFKWADMIDFISVSSFPDPKTTNHPGEAALSHDIMRGLKDQPFVLLEQAPSQVNWRLANVNKKPGVMRLWSHQGMAHGSDSFLFFQWRASVHGSEKFHSAMVPHIGENSRVFKEMVSFGNELPNLREIVGGDVQADVAIVLDYNNWWTCEFTPGPTALLKYLENLQAYHYPLFEQNITTDIVPVDRDLSKYKVVIAPLLYMIKPGFSESVEKFVSKGGTFITTFFSGVVNEYDEVFSGGYVTYSVCGPSRAGLMTGRYEQRFGFERNPQYKPDDPNMGLPRSEHTIAEVLKPAGYISGIIGKWHLGAHDTLHPLNRGFDFFYGHLGGGHCYFPEELTIQRSEDAMDEAESYRTWILRNQEPVPPKKYLTDAFSDEAVGFIERSKDKPFFLYLAYNAPHTPLQATEKYLSRFAQIKDKKRRTYAAMVSAVDDGVGRLLDKLDELKLADNTLVFFLSDNGGPEPVNASDNGSLRGGKSTVWEGGFRVPYAVCWPGVLPAGVTYDKPVSSLDILATIAALAEVPLDPERPLDGVNLVPFLCGETTSVPHEAIYLRKFDGQKYAVRQGDFKLVIDGRKTAPCLFNLASDIGETQDLAATLPEKLKELEQLRTEWAAELVDPRFLGKKQKKLAQKRSADKLEKEGSE